MGPLHMLLAIAFCAAGVDCRVCTKLPVGTMSWVCGGLAHRRLADSCRVRACSEVVVPLHYTLVKYNKTYARLVGDARCSAFPKHTQAHCHAVGACITPVKTDDDDFIKTTPRRRLQSRVVNAGCTFETSMCGWNQSIPNMWARVTNIGDFGGGASTSLEGEHFMFLETAKDNDAEVKKQFQNNKAALIMAGVPGTMVDTFTNCAIAKTNTLQINFCTNSMSKDLISPLCPVTCNVASQLKTKKGYYLISPRIQARAGGSINFHYKVHGTPSNALSLEGYVDGTWLTLWSSGRYNTATWMNASASLPPRTQQLRFGAKASGFQGSISIDSISISTPQISSKRCILPTDAHGTWPSLINSDVSAISCCAKGSAWDGMDGTACVMCHAGKYDHDIDAATPCEQCPPGRFSSVSGATTCDTCRSGTYAPTGSKYVSNCTSCRLGQYDHDASASTPCEQCPPGRFSSVSGATTCDTCRSGTYAPAGSKYVSNCTSCRLGQYDHDASAATPCEQCPPGRFSNVSGATTCDTCRSGTYAPAGSKYVSNCTSCRLGQYDHDTSAATHCVRCPVGRSANSGSIRCTVLCHYTVVHGCTDSAALNFDACASIDSGECRYSCEVLLEETTIQTSPTTRCFISNARKTMPQSRNSNATTLDDTRWSDAETRATCAELKEYTECVNGIGTDGRTAIRACPTACAQWASSPPSLKPPPPPPPPTTNPTTPPVLPPPPTPPTPAAATACIDDPHGLLAAA
eukprot:COSAG01_NODE_3103_length_6578_cov_112.775428_1_plen_745_part_10